MGKYSQKLMQHSGIVAGMCDEIKLVEIIDNLIKMPKRKVTVGQAIKSMILNALGFSGRALYLHHRFYKNRPVDILIGEGLTPEDLNDDCLGSALDAIFDYGLTELFFIIASHALRTYNIAHRFVHLDTTTFSLYGKYNADDDDDDTQVIKITKGYSKDNNPELNQVVVSLMCAYKSSIPVWIEALSGNSSDKKSFKKSISEYRKQFDKKNLPYFVADRALYTQDGLKQLSDIKWVSRVPETLKQAKEIIERTEKDEMEPKRIMALIMVMGLSLLVYSLAERKLRKVLKDNNLTVSNQVGKPTASPTIRWVFQNFEDVLMLEVQEGGKLKILITNMEEDHITIVKCLGKYVEKIYFCDS